MKRVRRLWRHRVALAAFFLAAALAVAVAQGLGNLNSVLVSMAQARARQLATDELNSALKHVLGDELQYTDFVSVTLDQGGSVAMLSANAALMNTIATETAMRAQERLKELGEHGIQLPLGAALGGSVFSGSGPKVTFSVIPVGTVMTNFTTEFENAGINQTRHKISLEATATVHIIVPTGTQPITVSARLLLAETILVGEVPDSYIQVTEVGDALNFMP